MTTKKELYSLKEGWTVSHRWYGECYVDNVVEDVGIVLIPHTEKGVEQMIKTAGRNISATLEANPHNILGVVRDDGKVVVLDTGYNGTLF